MAHEQSTTSHDQGGGSTTWEWRHTRVTKPPQAPVTAPRRGTFRSLVRREPRKPLLATLRLRGGPEGWIEVTSRGITYRCPGDRSVLDVVLDLNNAR
jgi:hypothetical protein